MEPLQLISCTWYGALSHSSIRRPRDALRPSQRTMVVSNTHGPNHLGMLFRFGDVTTPSEKSIVRKLGRSATANRPKPFQARSFVRTHREIGYSPVVAEHGEIPESANAPLDGGYFSENHTGAALKSTFDSTYITSDSWSALSISQQTLNSDDPSAKSSVCSYCCSGYTPQSLLNVV